jgi:hypothetical protein
MDSRERPTANAAVQEHGGFYCPLSERAISVRFQQQVSASPSSLLLFDVASKIALEALVWVTAPPVQQMRECPFHLSVEKYEIFLGSFPNSSLLPQGK